MLRSIALPVHDVLYTFCRSGSRKATRKNGTSLGPSVRPSAMCWPDSAVACLAHRWLSLLAVFRAFPASLPPHRRTGGYRHCLTFATTGENSSCRPPIPEQKKAFARALYAVIL